MSDYLKYVMNNGVIAGLINLAAQIILYFLGMNPLGTSSWLLAIIIIMLIVKGVKNWRDINGEGYITYGEAFRTGAALSFFYASFAAVMFYLFMISVGTDIMQMQIDEVMKGMEQAEKFMGAEMTDQIITEMKKMSEGRMCWGDFQNKLLGGVIISLIVAGVLKKNKPFFEEPQNPETSN